jgi:hypothetical protein
MMKFVGEDKWKYRPEYQIKKVSQSVENNLVKKIIKTGN